MSAPRRAPDMINANPHHAGSTSLAPASSAITESPTRVTRPTPTAAAPASRTFFDPWNSSSTGHQRAQNVLSGSTSWRASRNLKLGEQYRAGLGGGKRTADTVGAGSVDFGKDGRKANGSWEVGAKGLRTGGQKSLTELWAAAKSSKTLTQPKASEADHDIPSRQSPMEDHLDVDLDVSPASSVPLEKQVFAGLCIYVNGSTAPLVSDHKLKHILATHGARFSVAFGRRSVTHVILGTANGHGGAGGGLAASKIQKEITKSGGTTVRFVTAEW